MFLNTIKWEREKCVSWITLARPEIRNAVNYEMMEELEEVLQQIEQTNDKALVITGSGDRAFCSGGDLSLFQSLHTAQEAYSMLSVMGNVLKRLFLFPKPTIALLNGTAVGGGCELATACDFRIAKRTTKHGFVQGSLGITTGWGGGTMLYERTSSQTALTYLLSAQVFSAEYGYEHGFIYSLIDGENVKEECLAVLEPFLKQSAQVLEAYKQIWLNQLDLGKLEENIEKEIVACSTLWESDEHHNAVQKFLNK